MRIQRLESLTVTQNTCSKGLKSDFSLFRLKLNECYECRRTSLRNSNIATGGGGENTYHKSDKRRYSGLANPSYWQESGVRKLKESLTCHMASRCSQCGARTDEYGRYLPPPQADGYTCPSLTVDAGVVRRKDGPEILLITRGHPPFSGMRAFPGGFVDYNEPPEHAVARELKEETGLAAEGYPRIVGAFGNPLRDPRKHIVTLLYYIQVPCDAVPCGGDDAADASFYPIIPLWKEIKEANQMREDAGAPPITHEYKQGPFRVLAFDMHEILETFIQFLIKDGFFLEKEIFEMGFPIQQRI